MIDLGEHVEKLKGELQKRRMEIPVLIRKYDWENESRYIYPSEIFRNFHYQLNLGWSSLKTQVRRAVLKDLVDSYADGDISLSVYHLGQYCIYLSNASLSQYEGDFQSNILGKKRYEGFAKIPQAKLVGNDEYMIDVWQSLKYYYASGDSHNPHLSKVRIAFDPDFFGDHSGTHFYDCDWVEPVSGKSNNSKNQYRIYKGDKEVVH